MFADFLGRLECCNKYLINLGYAAFAFSRRSQDDSHGYFGCSQDETDFRSRLPGHGYSTGCSSSRTSCSPNISRKNLASRNLLVHFEPAMLCGYVSLSNINPRHAPHPLFVKHERELIPGSHHRNTCQLRWQRRSDPACGYDIERFCGAFCVPCQVGFTCSYCGGFGSAQVALVL